MSAQLTTRNESFYQHRDAGRLGDQQQRIMRIFHSVGAKPDYSSKEVSEILRIERSAAVARLNELEKIGYLEWGTPRKCSITGKTITPLQLPRGQQDLFGAARRVAA